MSKRRWSEERHVEIASGITVALLIGAAILFAKYGPSPAPERELKPAARMLEK